MANYRVLLVTNMWPYEGDPGYGAFVREQVDSLRRLGVEFEVLFIDGRQTRWNYVRAIGEMRRRLRVGHFELIHAHFGLSGWVARIQSRMPVVVTFHGDDVLGQFKRRGGITLLGRFFQVSSFVLARLVRAVIVQSRQMKSKLGVDSAHVIPCGIDLDLFRPMDRAEARRVLGLDLEKKYVLFPYDPAVERKRFDIIQAAVDRARHSLPELEILQVVNEPHERMPLYMNAADVLALASLAEGSPVAVKEAMATNLPVVTVDVGDTPELIASTKGCYLVARDPQAIAEKIVEVLRCGTRTRGRERMARLSMENIAKQILEVYASAARRR
jgi:teichuronic acid biosynthesis glycosyltransferase TuaC